MRIATWNINSVRARMPLLTAWLERIQPDILLLQEIKCETEAFPRMEIESLGYTSLVWGQKAYNGVAILSKHPIHEARLGLSGLAQDPEARYVEATIENIRIASLYVPNGNPVESDKYPYKLDWLARLKHRAAELLKSERPVILGGDYNVIPTPQDVYDPAGWEKDALYRLPTRRAFREILNLGYTDIFRAHHPAQEAYSFWDYQGGAWPQNKGLRIDQFLLSPEAVDRCRDCRIDADARGEEKASDHAPVLLDLVP